MTPQALSALKEQREQLWSTIDAVLEENAKLRAELDRLRSAPVAVEVPERVEQSILHDPPNSHGNCMSAVLAGLLRIPIESVPHFADPLKYGDDWRKQINAWLQPMGLAFIDGIGLSKRDWEEYGTDGLWGASAGRSPRDPSVSHMIAMKDGIDQWDPHPSQAGLDGDKRYTAFLVALRPWEVAHAITSDRILKDGEIHGTPEDLAAIAEGAGWEWIRSPIGGKILVDYMADALRAQRSAEGGAK